MARVRLKVGAGVQEAAVGDKDKSINFTAKVDAGPIDIEATLLDKSGKPLCSAYYVSIQKSRKTKP